MPEHRVSRPLILVADRNEIIRKVVREILTSHGCRVLSAATRAQAERILTRLSAKLDAVIADSTLETGFQCDPARALRPLAADIPILIMTNPAPHLQPGRWAVERPLAEQGYIRKPFTQSLLLSKLHEMLSARALRAEQAAARPAILYKTASLSN
jgi:CheY-like chemotaxis protein